jgi:hypothetical protein
MIICSFQRIVNKWLRQRRGQPAGHAGLETCLIAITWGSDVVGPDASIERAKCDTEGAGTHRLASRCRARTRGARKPPARGRRRGSA